MPPASNLHYAGFSVQGYFTKVRSINQRFWVEQARSRRIGRRGGRRQRVGDGRTTRPRPRHGCGRAVVDGPCPHTVLPSVYEMRQRGFHPNQPDKSWYRITPPVQPGSGFSRDSFFPGIFPPPVILKSLGPAAPARRAKEKRETGEQCTPK